MGLLPAMMLASALQAVAIAEPSGNAADADAPGRPARVHFVGGAGGVGGSYVEGDESWAFEVSFEQSVSDLLSLEFSYFNEGHPDAEGHRDGFALQLFANVFPFALLGSDPTSFLAHGVRLRGGAGPTVYFNTLLAPGEVPREQTGAGVKLTGAIDVRIAGGFSIGPRVEDHLGIDSQNAVVVGLDINYELFPAPERIRESYAAVAATGKSVRNAQTGSGVPAYVALERTNLFGSNDVGVSAAFLAIGGPNDRIGGAVGPEANRRFGAGGNLELGVGVAPYFYGDGKDTGQEASGVAALIKTTASYRVWKRWKLVAMFLREAGSPEQQNYDVFLGGIGVDFDLPPRRTDEAPPP